MKKKLVSLLAAMTVGLLTFTGCATADNVSTGTSTQGTQEQVKKEEQQKTTQTGSSDEVDVNEDGTVNNPEAVKIDSNKLVFWSLFSGGDGGFMDQIIADYNVSSPTKQVQSIMLVWADYYTKLQTAVAAGKGPDIGVSHVSKLPELVDQGVVISISDVLDELGIDLAQYYPQNSIDSVTFDGEVYALPLDTHAEIIYYNKDILDQAGIVLTADGKLPVNSANEFKAMLDQIKAVMPEGSSTISLSNQGDDPYRVWWALYYQLGGSAIVNDEGTEVTLDKDKAVEAASFVKSLYDEGYIIQGIDDHQAFFQSGKAALQFGGTWAVGAFEKTEGLNFGCQAFPKFFDNTACWADSHTLILPMNKSRTTDETKAAVEFIFATTDVGGAIWAQSGQIPSNKAVLQSEAFKALKYRNGYTSALEDSVLPSKNPNFYAMKSGMIESLNALWVGQLDAEAAIDALYNELQSNLD